ncbi:MAG: type IV pilus assembly protein PilM [Firmicutes bacterium]|nr:type IV pilus assembly protein PilM [Bacillota bacterium]
MPAKRKPGGPPTVGLDIGSGLIKVVEARSGKAGPQITALGVCPTPDGVVSDDLVMDPPALGKVIKQLLADNGIQAKRCVSSVSGQSSVVVRIIEVPMMSSKELQETMKWEIERHVPFSASEIVMDFAAIEKTDASPADQNMEVLLAVAQQELVNRHVETLFAAGLDPVAIDVEPLAASRSVLELSGNGDLEQTVALVNIGNDITDISIFRNGVLAFPRSLPLAGKAITRALSDTLQITSDQAEQLKRERARVMMERADQYMDSGGFGNPDAVDAGGGFGSATMGLSGPASGPESDDNMDFIPGLGFTSMGGGEEPAPAEASSPAPVEPAFDIDIGDGPSGSALPFDLGMDDASSEFAPVAAPGLDLSGEIEDIPDLITPARPNGAVQEEVSTDLVEVEMPHFADEMIFDSIAPVLHDLVAELRRSIEYFISRYQTQPDRIILCGGTAKIPDLDKFFEAQLGIPTVVANPLHNIEVFSKGISEDYLREVASVFPVSIGLAIRDMIGE